MRNFSTSPSHAPNIFYTNDVTPEQIEKYQYDDMIESFGLRLATQGNEKVYERKSNHGFPLNL